MQILHRGTICFFGIEYPTARFAYTQTYRTLIVYQSTHMQDLQIGLTEYVLLVCAESAQGVIPYCKKCIYPYCKICIAYKQPKHLRSYSRNLMCVVFVNQSVSFFKIRSIELIFFVQLIQIQFLCPCEICIGGGANFAYTPSVIHTLSTTKKYPTPLQILHIPVRACIFDFKTFLNFYGNSFNKLIKMLI